MKSSRGNTAACQLKLFLVISRHSACNLLEDGMSTLLKNAPIRYGAVRGDSSENATEFWVGTLISYGTVQPHSGIRATTSYIYRIYGGTAPKCCMFHKRSLLPLPSVEHTKLRSCTSVCRLSQLLTRFIVTDNVKN